jgi:hypothetical protein
MKNRARKADGGVEKAGAGSRSDDLEDMEFEWCTFAEVSREDSKDIVK